MQNLLRVSLRQQAIYIPESALVHPNRPLTESCGVLVTNLAKLGFATSEALLRALNRTSASYQELILNTLREVMGVQKNWTPLVKGWDVPTGESVVDHIITFFANAFNKTKGTRLQCGHVIPEGTFPLERYNGCPFCGTPFEFEKLELKGQGSKLKVLEFWDEKALRKALVDLLESKTALDATQMDSLKLLLNEVYLPENVQIGMKETLMAVIDLLLANERADQAQLFFKSPTDILRYLWYKHTGFLQIVEPSTIVRRKAQNQGHINRSPKKNQKVTNAAALAAKAELKLKFGRKLCAVVAKWLNELPMDAAKACETMHPKREMWVRFIRALRLPEYAKRAGFERLSTLLDVFYNEKYEVWQGRVQRFQLRRDAESALALLRQRPGLFARALFSSILWFGRKATIKAFGEVIDRVPARLVFTLNMYAPLYFDPTQNRTVKPLGSVSKTVAANPLVKKLGTGERTKIVSAVEDLCLSVVHKRFAAQANPNKTMYIAPNLFYIPVSIGDRSENVQDAPSALMGARFPVEGARVRLFMQWGTGLPAQHMDMDLSCWVSYANKSDYCSFSNLAPKGCRHSGDIRSIPDKIGTAEYIEIDLNELRDAGALYVTFTCNAFSNGGITPNLMLGWMSSKHPMKISAASGVAYDPSCVQHQVRVTQPLAKGLIFGVLDVKARQVIWLEMPFHGQTVHGFSMQGVEALLAKLSSKISVGSLLAIKATAQKLRLVDAPELADESYTMQWAMNTAAVTRLLVD